MQRCDAFSLFSVYDIRLRSPVDKLATVRKLIFHSS